MWRSLYQQHQNQQIQIEAVTLVNNLGEEVRPEPLTATQIAALKPLTLDGGDRITTLLSSQPDTTVLRCPI